MTTNHSTVYVLTESVTYEDTTILGIYADKLDALSDAHNAAHKRQTGHYEDYDTTHWSNDSGSESVGLGDHVWTVAPTVVQ